MDGTGDIICSLDELLLVAAEHWRTPLTQQDLARMSSLSRSTINELLPRRVQERALGGAAAETELVPFQGRIALRTIAALCSVFICLPGELLRYRTPGQALPRLSPNAVRRNEVPLRQVYIYPLTNNIPERLQAYTPAALSRATGITWGTWKRAKAGTTQIELSTLAAICALLNTDVSGLFTHTVPFRDSTWSVRWREWRREQLPILEDAVAKEKARQGRHLAPGQCAGRGSPFHYTVPPERWYSL